MYSDPQSPDSQSPFIWQLEINPPWNNIEALRQQLRHYNAEMGQTHKGTNLAIFIRDDEEKLVGGIAAYLWGPTIEINFLWLSEHLRGQGLGKQLMAEIEKAAVERGARQATLSTFSFQAPDFYKQLGYETIAVIDDLGNGHQKFYLRKTL